MIKVFSEVVTKFGSEISEEKCNRYFSGRMNIR